MAETVALHLDEPVRVVNLGVGVHGVRSARDVYRLPDLWQLHLYRYAADLVIGGHSHPVRPGSVSLVAADVPVEFAYRGRSEHLYVHFRPGRSGQAQEIPVVQDAGAELPLLSGLLLDAIHTSLRESVRVVADVWAVLWRIARLGEFASRPHAAVSMAVAYIEANLSQPLTVPELAEAAGVSHNHLTRLFRATTGSTVVGFIAQRRMARAHHLLVSSTMPIPAIAASVGVSDLQAFNKMCRKRLGASPRAIRASGAGP